MIVTQIVSEREDLNAILACADASIKVLSDQGKVIVDQKFGSSINSLSLSEQKSSRNNPIVAFGLQNGAFGLAEVTKEEVIVLWDIDYTDMGLPKRQPVSFVQLSLIKEKEHCVVVRDDSAIELYVI